jgi:hypothetical protein
MNGLDSFSKIGLVCALAWMISQVTSSAQQQSAGPGLAGAASESGVLDKYCVSCHSDKAKTGGLTLEKRDLANVAASPDVWEKVVLKLRAGMMPPTGLPRLDKASRENLIGFLETSLDRAADLKPNPGRTETFHRLNRAEYQNSVRDLLHLDIDASEFLPVDDASYGFDRRSADVARADGALHGRSPKDQPAGNRRRIDRPHGARISSIARTTARRALGWNALRHARGNQRSFHFSGRR